MIKKAFRLVSSLFRIATVLVLVSVTVIEGPSVHGSLIRGMMVRSVTLISIKITDTYGTSGTGFHVKTPSGKLVMLTNRHICEDSPDGYVMAAREVDRQFTKLKILKMSKTTDLCETEAIPGASPLRVASGLFAGDDVAIYGHPQSFPLTPTKGSVIGVINLSVSENMHPQDFQAGKCRWDNSKITDDKDENGNPVKVCTEANRTVMTTAQVAGGSSGSPLVNRYGNVVGVVYCSGRNDINSGSIPLKELREFLKDE